MLINRRNTQIRKIQESIRKCYKTPEGKIAINDAPDVIIISNGAQVFFNEYGFRNPDRARDYMIADFTFGHWSKVLTREESIALTSDYALGRDVAAPYLMFRDKPPNERIWIKTPASRKYITVETDQEHREGSLWLQDPALQGALRRMNLFIVPNAAASNRSSMQPPG